MLEDFAFLQGKQREEEVRLRGRDLICDNESKAVTVTHSTSHSLSSHLISERKEGEEGREDKKCAIRVE